MSSSNFKNRYKFLSVLCPDEKCQAPLYFPSYATSIECTHCGQRYERSFLRNIKDINYHECMPDLRNFFLNTPKKGPESIKVLGLSNYHCKLISPFFTTYGMDKKTGKAVSLTEMNQGNIFDCSLLGDRSFCLDPEHISVPGYGRDISGSMNYLADTLNAIKLANDSEERLIPIHADGDGHCLVHAISRSLVGRELFWHPLRCSLKEHFKDNLQKYKELFKDYEEEQEWKSIIAECDPDFIPPEGELLGLRNIHVFGLANVLKRPIILLDSLMCMRRSADYAALFLPGLIPSEECRGKDGHLNKPLCIAWSSSGHNHYIPLVGIKNRQLPQLPRNLVPKVWGVAQNLTDKYIEFNEDGCLTIGGERSLGDAYINRLVTAMESVFLDRNGVSASLVADVHHFLFQSRGVISPHPHIVIQATKNAVKEGILYKCINCKSVCEQSTYPGSLKKDGRMNKMALMSYLDLLSLLISPPEGLSNKHDQDESIPHSSMILENCTFCLRQGKMRLLRSDGSIQYKNGDSTRTRSNICNCGYKHFWFGKEYDNNPKILKVTLDWNYKVLHDEVYWFQNESDPSLNSNVYKVAAEIVQEHLPGEFGSECLVQRVVEQLLEQTRVPENFKNDAKPVCSENSEEPSPQKMILSGHKILHKEELGVSETERSILKRIESNAATNRRHSIENEKNSSGVSKDNLFKSKSNKVSSIPSTSSMTAASKTKFIRVVTSDGRQAQLHLDSSGVTFQKLQTWIENTFSILPSNQRIKCGFPLQELHSSKLKNPDEPLSLSHGDRVVVEILNDISNSQILSSDASNVQNAVSTEADIAHQLSKFEEAIKQYLGNSHAYIHDNPIEHHLKTLESMAKKCGITTWEFACNNPDLFCPGGLFYLNMQRIVGLIHGIHCSFLQFPNKKFMYSAENDRVELCIEPHGHIPISEDVIEFEDKLIEMHKVNAFCADRRCQYFSTTSGVSVNNSRKKTKSEIPFQGAGYSLKDSTKNKDRDSAVEEKNFSVSPPQQPLLIRKGPGFSVLASEESPASQISNSQLISLYSPSSSTNLEESNAARSCSLSTVTLECEDIIPGDNILVTSNAEASANVFSLPEADASTEAAAPLLDETMVLDCESGHLEKDSDSTVNMEVETQYL